MSNKIKLKTKDGFNIVGEYYFLEDEEGKDARGAVVLIHMMPETKESWQGLAEKLVLAGYKCLAIDMRGHGESDGGPDGFKTFTDSEHQAGINDIESAVEFFIDKGIPKEKIILIGASIGANLSLQYQAWNSEIKRSILLSPGLDYHGVGAEKMAELLEGDQFSLLIAGGEGGNDESSTETVKKLHGVIEEGRSKVIILKEADHGTRIFEKEPGLMEEIINWLD